MFTLDLQALFHSTARWRSGQIDDASYAGLYFLHWQAASHGKRFAARRHRNDPRPDHVGWFDELARLDREQTRRFLLRCFERYQYLGVIANVPDALAAWLRREWSLMLVEHVPGSREVLKMQTEGRRPVTVLSSWPRMVAPVLARRNAFAFMVHDLEHAWKFFADPEMHRQQRDFFRVILDALEAGCFADYLGDPVFSGKFDYLISDMNTHTMHAAQFLRAILVEFFLRREKLINPDELSRPARDVIYRLMVSLLGNECSAAVEKRMLRRGSMP